MSAGFESTAAGVRAGADAARVSVAAGDSESEREGCLQYIVSGGVRFGVGTGCSARRIGQALSERDKRYDFMR